MKPIAATRRTTPRLNLGFLLVAALIFSSPCLVIAQGTNDNSNTNRAANLTNNTNGNTGGNTNGSPSAGAPKPKTTPCPAADAPVPKVTNVYKDASSGVKDVELGDVIVVQGENFDTLLQQAACENKNIVLYLDDRPLKDVTAFPPTDPANPFLKFTLKRTEDSREVWTYILGAPTWAPRPTKIGVGIADKHAIASDEKNTYVKLEVIPHGWFFLWFILFALLLSGFLILAFKSNLLRDNLTTPVEGARPPYSLARTQAAWWFFLILASYLFIGIITGDFSTTITTTVLGLLGISAGTAVGSAMVDANKSTPEAAASEAAAATEADTRVGELDAEIAAAKTTLDANPGDMAAAQTLAAKTKEKEDTVSQLKKLTNQSENFVLDILSDVNGISFHRFQIAAWTLVLGIIFVIQVYKVLAMPEFNGTLLALLGISAGTFVTLKIPEATVPRKQP
jgi:hypothetical protein